MQKSLQKQTTWYMDKPVLPLLFSTRLYENDGTSIKEKCNLQGGVAISQG